MANNFRYGLGWMPELPDVRDYRPEHETVQPMIAKTRAKTALTKPKKALRMNSSADLRKWCSPIEDQGQLGSCTAHAAVGLVEYFERRAVERHIDASRLFVYKVTRNLLHWKGDTGAYLRSAMQALVMLGAPPEEFWPYSIGKFDDEPPQFCYALASNFKSVKYFRLDPPGGTTGGTLERVKQFLAGGYPSMFGFTVYDSIDSARDGKIPFPSRGDRVVGGHAVMAVGYDDKLAIGRQKGALLIRNSWGTGWGDKGYGWLPYTYVEAGLADDFWSVQSQQWVDTGQFAT